MTISIRKPAGTILILRTTGPNPVTIPAEFAITVDQIELRPGDDIAPISVNAAELGQGNDVVPLSIDTTELGQGNDVVAPQADAKDKSGKGKYIDERMAKLLIDNPSTIGWTVDDWAKKLKCSKSTVHGTATWKTIMTTRKLMELDKWMRRRHQ
jgi:hypothetical protein